MEEPPKTGLLAKVVDVFNRDAMLRESPSMRIEIPAGLQCVYAFEIMSLISWIMGEEATAALPPGRSEPACLSSSNEDRDTAKATAPIMP